MPVANTASLELGRKWPSGPLSLTFHSPNRKPNPTTTLEQLYFPESGHGGNFHCGNVPRGLIGECRDIPVRLKHYGYMLPEQRQEKYKWYTSIDPNNQSEDQYRHLAEVRGARFAPGPPQVVKWVE